MDYEQIQQAIGLASSAVGLTGKATSTVTSIKSLFSSDKPADSDEAARLLNTLATELTSANMMNVQLSDALRQLNTELQRQDAFSREKEKYELFRTPAGDHVFRLKDEFANGQQSHFICPVCLNRDSLISYMRGEYSLTCQTDRNHWVDYRPSPSSY